MTEISDGPAYNYDKIFTPLQPDHGPRHITSPEELPLGIVIEEVGSDGAAKLCVLALGKRLAQNDQLTDDPRWMLVARQDMDGAIVPESRSMADCGLVPYGHGMWNRHNFLRTLLANPQA